MSGKSTGQSIWPKIPSPFVRAMLAGHSALGLAFAALIYIVCLTGTIAVLAHELHRWERPTAPMLESVTPQAVERIVSDAVARHPEMEHLFVSLPDDDMRRLSAYVDLPGENDPQYVADSTGRIVADGHAPWTDFLLNLHIFLHLPQSWGIFVVGATGVALLSSLISGLFAHPRVFRDAFHLRWGADKRLQEADLHNRIGVWGLPFHIIISLTGALIGLTTVIVGFLAFVLFQGDMDRAYSLFLPPEPVENHAPASLPLLAPMFETVMREAPTHSVSQVIYEHPGTAGQGVMFLTTAPGELSSFSTFTFDGAGAIQYKQIVADSTIGVKMLQAVSALHFGWFGGWALKLVYILLGAGLTVVTTSGVAVWLARRRAKGRPAPMWERAWIATVWSQPAALALAALAAFAAAGAPLVAVWALVTVGVIASGAAWTPAQISWRWRAVTALVLLALPFVHAAAVGVAGADAMVWPIDAAIIALGLLLAATLRTSARPAPEALAPAQEQPR